MRELPEQAVHLPFEGGPYRMAMDMVAVPEADSTVVRTASGSGQWIGPVDWASGLGQWIGPVDWASGSGRSG